MKGMFNVVNRVFCEAKLNSITEKCELGSTKYADGHNVLNHFQFYYLCKN